MGKVEAILGYAKQEDNPDGYWECELNKGTLAKVHIQNPHTRIEMTVEEFIQSFAPTIIEGAKNLRKLKGIADG